MNPYTLTLLRHGGSAESSRLSGHKDVAAHSTAWEKMHNSWQQIVAIAPVSTMATSPLLRCREFAVRQALATSVPLKVDPRFSACDVGAWAGRPLDELNQEHPDWRVRWQKGEFHIPDSESMESFRTRVLTGFSAWIASTRGSHRVLITHADVIASILAELLDMAPSAARLITVEPGGYAQLSILQDHPAYLMRLESPPG